MSKIIINHDETVTDLEATMAVYLATEQGRISSNKHGKHYCWHTSFGNGIQVGVKAKRHKDAADSFVVWKKEDETIQ